MKVAGKVVAVTGAGGGIGEGLARRFAAEGAAKVVVSDLDPARCERVAAEIGGLAFPCDVSDPARLEALVEFAEDQAGPVGLRCSNAGVGWADPVLGQVASSPDAAWQKGWEINVMAHVRAARLLAPKMAARGGGWFLHTVSAAGLLSQIDGAVYATTKHAAIGFAEALAITHRDDGIRVSVLCPQGVDTEMLRGLEGGAQGVDGVLTPEAVAQTVIEGLEAESFLILPHAQVRDYMANKAASYDRWLAGMAKLRRKINGG